MCKLNATPIFFGHLPKAYFDHFFLSNISELIFDKSLYTLLRFCGLKENEIGEQASDFDRFRAYCKATECLTGHPILQKNELLLRTCFGIDLPCNLPNCNTIWNDVSDRLLQSNMSPLERLQKAAPDHPFHLLMDITALEKQEKIFPDISPVLFLNPLVDTQTVTWEAWKNQIDFAFERLHQLTGNAVCMNLQLGSVQSVPSLYAVEQALKSDKKTTERLELLMVQLLRQACINCKKTDATLYLELSSVRLESTVNILKQLFEQVGLPNIVCYAKDISHIEKMLQLDAELPYNRLQCGFLTGYYPSAKELQNAYTALISRYPSGKLHVLLGDDLRYANYELQCFKLMIK